MEPLGCLVPRRRPNLPFVTKTPPPIYDQRYPARQLLDLIADKWTPIILYCLSGGTRRFSELQHQIPDISKKMLIQVLRRLENASDAWRTMASLIVRSIPLSRRKQSIASRPWADAFTSLSRCSASGRRKMKKTLGQSLHAGSLKTMPSAVDEPWLSNTIRLANSSRSVGSPRPPPRTRSSKSRAPASDELGRRSLRWKRFSVPVRGTCVGCLTGRSRSLSSRPLIFSCSM